MADDVQLTAVSETMFLPAYCLAIESERDGGIIRDPNAVALAHTLDAAMAASDRPLYRRLAERRLPSTLITTMSLRIRQYDRWAADFVRRVPDAVVVNLGCGLDDRRARVDDGRMSWYDLDLPEVIDFRRRFIPDADRLRSIGVSALDPAWMDELPDAPATSHLFIAEGLFMYLPGDEVRKLVVALAERFPGSELIAEVANSRLVRTMETKWGRGKFRRQFSLSEDVVYGFGIDDSSDFEAWAPGIRLIDDWTYWQEDEPRLGWMRPFSAIRFVSHAQWSVHYRLGEPA